MGTELQEHDAIIIESYISYISHNQSSSSGTGAEGSAIRSEDKESNGQSEEEVYEKQGSQLLQAARQDESFRVADILASNPYLIWYWQPYIRNRSEPFNRKGTKDVGNMVIHVAAKSGHMSTLQTLMDFINIHKHSTFKFKSPLLETNRNRDTALHLALEHCHKKVASYLINEMPSEIVFACNFQNIMPVNLAIRAGYGDLVQDMLQRAPWSSLSQHKRNVLMQSSILHDAIFLRHLGPLQIILEHMPALIESKLRGVYPLQYAALHGCIDEVCYILNKYPDCAHRCDDHGTFPIHSAVNGKNLDIVNKFVSSSPETMDYIDTVGRKPLSFAAHHGNHDQVCYFLTNFPTYATVCDEDGSFPIHTAIVSGHIDIVKEFISCCPESVSQVNGEGRSILHLAVQYRRADVLSYLKTIPELKQMYHVRDAWGNTFVDLVKNQMKDLQERHTYLAILKNFILFATIFLSFFVNYFIFFFSIPYIQ